MKQIKSFFGGVLVACFLMTVLCSISAYAAPSVTITSYTSSIELDYLGSVQWTISTDTKETGVNYAYKSDKSDAKGVVSPITGLTSYAALVVPKRGNCQIYFRVYAKGSNGVIVYSPWYMISTAAYCSAYAMTAYQPTANLAQVPVMKDAESGQLLYASASSCTDKEIPFEIQELDYAYIVGDTVTDFAIGGCMNNGIVSFNCALDLGGILPVGKLASIAKLDRFTKFAGGLNKLKQGYTTTKFLGSIQKVSSAVKKMFVWSSKGTKTTRTGKEVAEGVSQGILREEIAATGKIFEKTEFQKLGDWVLEKGTASVNRLKGTGTTNELMESVIKNGGSNLDEVRYIGQDTKSLTRWVENGNTGWGWQKIWKKHVTGEISGGTKFSVITNDLSESNIKKLIFDALKDSKTVIKESPTKNKYCYFSKVIKNGYYILVIVDRGSKNGAINTAYPNNDLSTACHD